MNKKLSFRRRLGLRLSAIVSLVIFCSLAKAATVAHVINGNDNGFGSLRYALNSGATKIIINPSVTNIITSSSLQYNSTSSLKIIGTGQTVDGSTHGQNILSVTSGADLSISNLAFVDNTGYSVFNQGGGKGIYISVPIEHVGTVSLKLKNVLVSGVGRHGVHVSDCDLETCGAGGGGGGDGSSASINVKLNNVTILGVGYGDFDSDGIRVDDRGEGDIKVHIKASSFIDVGADGVELDEGNDGDVIVKVTNSLFEGNGGYCAPIDISGFPVSDEVIEAPGHDPTADDRCVEWDETEYALDLDDGFDIDEAGNGILTGTISNIEINSNLDEGLDFDEEDDGGIFLNLYGINANFNGDEGIKLSEANEGNVKAKLRAVTTIGNGDDGIQIEEEDNGNLKVKVNSTISYDNKSSKAGLKVTQDGEGSGTLKVRGSDISSIDTNVTVH